MSDQVPHVEPPKAPLTTIADHQEQQQQQQQQQQHQTTTSSSSTSPGSTSAEAHHRSRNNINESAIQEGLESRDTNRRVVIFDEKNLKENREWHLAHPVTKHITEPDTPYAHDDGEYADSETSSDAGSEHHHHHEQHDQHSSSREHSAENSTTATTEKKEGEGEGETNNKAVKVTVEQGSWVNADYNHIGTEALRNEPTVFTTVAPTTPLSAATTNAVVQGDEGEQQKNQNENQNQNKEQQQQQGPRKKLGITLSLQEDALSEEGQAKAQQARHDHEFKTMRKAVYRDEGMKFRELMKHAAEAKDDEDEDED